MCVCVYVSTGLVMDMDAADTLQVNISGLMIDAIVNAYATVLRRVDRAIHELNAGGSSGLNLAQMEQSSSLSTRAAHVATISAMNPYQAAFEEKLSSLQRMSRLAQGKGRTPVSAVADDGETLNILGPSFVVRNRILTELCFKISRKGLSLPIILLLRDIYTAFACLQPI
jgi:hypothetical protein